MRGSIPRESLDISDLDYTVQISFIQSLKVWTITVLEVYISALGPDRAWGFREDIKGINLIEVLEV